MPEGASSCSISRIHITATQMPTSLVLEVDADTQVELQSLRLDLNGDRSDAFSSDSNLYDVFEWLICNSEYEFVQAEETGDLTAAPLLGIRDEHRNVVQRWGFMDYQLRSPQDDLADVGRCEFVC
jgi:hypothetical protein